MSLGVCSRRQDQATAVSSDEAPQQQQQQQHQQQQQQQQQQSGDAVDEAGLAGSRLNARAKAFVPRLSRPFVPLSRAEADADLLACHDDDQWSHSSSEGERDAASSIEATGDVHSADEDAAFQATVLPADELAEVAARALEEAIQ